MVTTFQVVAEFTDLTPTYTKVEYYPTINGVIFFRTGAAVSSRDYGGVPANLVTFINQDINDIKAELSAALNSMGGGYLSGVFQSDPNQTTVDYLNSDLPPGAVATMNSTIAGKASATHTHAASDITSGTKTSEFISDFTEAAQDAVGAALSSEFVYDDAGNNISLRALSFNNTPNRSSNITTGTGATGFQISSTRDALVNYSVTITTAVQIGVVTNVDGYVVLEIASTNSATSGDWVEIARVPQAQNIGLAVALSSTQKGGGNLTGIVPAGYYAKIRTVNNAGTPIYTYNSGQEVLL